MSDHPARSVLSLIADPARPGLDDAAVAAVRSAVAGLGEPRWLANGVAVEFVADGQPAGVEGEARRALAGRPIDVVVQPEAYRRKRLLVADMDSTIIGQECIDELAEKVGLRAEISAVTERAMRGEIAFEPALRQRVALLKGLPESVIGEVIRDRIRVNPGAAALVRTMRASGGVTALVSGGFTVFTGPIAALVGFDEHHSNTLLMEHGVLKGEVSEPILGREAKLATLERLTAKLGLSREETLAVGDGANDLSMIQAAGLGVAFHAKPIVAAAAPARIDHGDLTALLYLQGYAREEFAA